ncbi:Arfaptin-1 [Acipenser ruthenus]|uniref:Arfaptin-1 n=1 Tax=Acipenser ruthenus TaxID=7906 RepID=A0A662YUE3_ACIRT|nr:Arfaptin-1 [Acipenser ruthenus]
MSNQGIVVINSFVYLIGGDNNTRGFRAESRCWRYDPRHDRWFQIQSMQQQHADHCVCALGGYLYTIGGRDHHNELKVVERYDLQTNTWEFVDPLKQEEEFGFNAETQKLLSKNGETLLGAINFFICSVKTLVDKTIEDTMVNIKQYENARIEYDAYRTDLEELNLGPRDATTVPKIEQSQYAFQAYREKYEKMRNDVSIKLKFLEENKVKVLHNQLVLFQSAIAAYYAGNQKQLEQTLKQFHIKLKTPGADTPSWLEEQ